MAKLALDDFTDPQDRQAKLSSIRNLKMARSAQRFVRGSTKQFYAWLEKETNAQIPDGPAIWICGDCHVGNIGPIGSVEGAIDIVIRDLDQTVVGNPAHDLIRLSLSLATSIRSSDLPGVTTALMIEQVMQGYEYAFKHPRSDGHELQPISVAKDLKNAFRRRWKHLANDRIKNADPSIPLGSRFWPVTDEESEAIEKLFDQDNVRKLLTTVWWRDDEAKVRVLDRAYWMKGCSSLGLMRFAALVSVGKKNGKKDQNLSLIDIKQAVAPLAVKLPNQPSQANNAIRIVTGAQALSPQLGNRMVAATLLDRPVFVRELFPQDLKLDLDQLPRAEVEGIARYLAWVVGRAHARQLNKTERLDWLKRIGRQRKADLAAPTWLWSAVVELAGLHESAYLEHCRIYSLGAVKGAVDDVHNTMKTDAKVTSGRGKNTKNKK